MQRLMPLLATVLMLAAPKADAESRQVRGSEFVTIMNGNTLVATSKAGVKFKAYFLRGGLATYEDENGVRDEGSWLIKDDDEVCVAWKTVDNGAERCARVSVDGTELIWKGENISGQGRLLGSIQ